jgi:hypothetical protein
MLLNLAYAYVKGLSLENLRSSFRRAGIYPLNKSPYPPQVYLPSTVYTQTMTEKLNDNTLPLTPIQTDRIDCSPPMDLSPDVTQMHVESPTKNLTPNILTHASADSPPMDLSLDIFLFLDDIDRVDVTDNGQENDVVQDGHKTTSDRPIDKDMTNSPDLSAFFLGREKCVTNKTHKKNNRKYMSKLVSGIAITEENVIACIQEHCESKK